MAKTDRLSRTDVARRILSLPPEQQRRALLLVEQLYGGTPPPLLAQGTVPTIIEVMESPEWFADWFPGPTWDPWKAFLCGVFALPMTPELEELWLKHTQREPPDKQAAEAWMVVGRRGGKSRIAALLAVYLACFRDYEPYLAPGEVATIPIISADRKSARTVMRYVKAFLNVEQLRGRIVGKPLTEAVTLTPRVQIETQTGNFRAVRSYTVVTAICDEIAFWETDEDAANPDEEVLKALKPTMASIPGALLVGLSSPYARKGVLWDRYEKYYGKDVPELVWKAATLAMHPGNAALNKFVAEEYEKDPEGAAAEYGGEFRTDVGFFVSPEAVAAVTVLDRAELEPLRGVEYVAFVDPSGGAQDSMTLAVAHQAGGKAVLDLLREVKPPFSPEQVVTDFAAVLKRYRVETIVGDAYGGEWPRERFGVHDVFYKPSELNKSQLYLEMLAVINSKRCELLDHPCMRRQLLDLERRTARGGRDTVDHPPSKHDDVVNAAAGALSLVVGAAGWESIPLDDEQETPQEQQMRKDNPMMKQLHEALPVLKPKQSDEAEYKPTCGNCHNKYRDPRSGVWRCKTGMFLIDLKATGCDRHEPEDED